MEKLPKPISKIAQRPKKKTGTKISAKPPLIQQMPYKG
jgi:hypothetical protein